MYKNNRIVKKFIHPLRVLSKYIYCAFLFVTIFPIVSVSLAQTEIREPSRYQGQGSAFGSSVSTSSRNELYVGTPFSDAGFSLSTANDLDTGAVSVFAHDGKHLRTITLPSASAPMRFDQFGASLSNTKVGNTELLLVGAPGKARGNSFSVGGAYLFAAANGQLVESFFRPNSFSNDDRFGHSVDAEGQNYLIGAPGVKKNAGMVWDSGAVYYFERVSNGTNSVEITNPDSNSTSVGDKFGWSVAQLGPGKFAVGVPGDDDENTNAGAVWIFDNPDDQSPKKIVSGNNARRFGHSLVPLGNDLLLVGAPFENFFGIPNNITESGSVYIVNHQSGTVVAEITNPNPQDYAHFGISMWAEGDYIVIGAPGSFSSQQRGDVYVFSISQNKLLASYKGPKLTNTNYPGLFGDSVALFGTTPVIANRQETNLLVGAPLTKGRYERQGAAYVYKYCGTPCLSSPSIKDGYDDTIFELLKGRKIDFPFE